MSNRGQFGFSEASYSDLAVQIARIRRFLRKAARTLESARNVMRATRNHLLLMEDSSASAFNDLNRRAAEQSRRGSPWVTAGRRSGSRRLSSGSEDTVVASSSRPPSY